MPLFKNSDDIFATLNHGTGKHDFAVFSKIGFAHFTIIASVKVGDLDCQLQKVEIGIHVVIVGSEAF